MKMARTEINMVLYLVKNSVHRNAVKGETCMNSVPKKK